MAFWFRCAAVALCFGATAGTISPIGRYEIAAFQWDDDAYVTNNELLTARDGLRRIWFSFDSLARHCLRSKRSNRERDREPRKGFGELSGIHSRAGSANESDRSHSRDRREIRPHDTQWSQAYPSGRQQTWHRRCSMSHNCYDFNRALPLRAKTHSRPHRHYSCSVGHNLLWPAHSFSGEEHAI